MGVGLRAAALLAVGLLAACGDGDGVVTTGISVSPAESLQLGVDEHTDVDATSDGTLFVLDGAQSADEGLAATVWHGRDLERLESSRKPGAPLAWPTLATNGESVVVTGVECPRFDLAIIDDAPTRARLCGDEAKGVAYRVDPTTGEWQSINERIPLGERYGFFAEGFSTYVLIVVSQGDSEAYYALDYDDGALSELATFRDGGNSDYMCQVGEAIAVLRRGAQFDGADGESRRPLTDRHVHPGFSLVGIDRSGVEDLSIPESDTALGDDGMPAGCVPNQGFLFRPEGEQALPVLGPDGDGELTWTSIPAPTGWPAVAFDDTGTVLTAVGLPRGQQSLVGQVYSGGEWMMAGSMEGLSNPARTVYVGDRLVYQIDANDEGTLLDVA